MKKQTTVAWRLLSVLMILTMLMSITLSVAPVPVVQAADTGWHSPSANAADAGDGFEEYPTYAYANDDNCARNWDGPDDSHRYYAFGFDSSAIPAGADVIGIEVRLDGSADSADNSPWYDVHLSWDGGSSWSSVRPTPSLQGGSASFPYYVVGGQSDLWGRSAWFASELADANFRVRITSRATGIGSTDRDFYLDRVSVDIIYASAHI